ncbi:hypothetical protein N7462_001332 [Penicillium macrosclerotiorum]|uniref:uncharacterized protein n=1 Tax=Penicillium macrosclerotiorum TaxID=303699 RepID=UPI002548DAB8|nr:uncharacterized protein N7462_001332 [Penicillium macrosclerotiorum]KAJ5691909.1 hypothetical protein N7462_001332 [Penicillium macrosclerotiorum]
MAASVVAINTKPATYHVGCLKDAPKTDCNYPTSWTIIQSPETVSSTGKYIASTSEETTSYDIIVTQSYECSPKSSTELASCTMSAGMSGSLDGGKYELSTSSKATYTTEPFSNSYYQLTVTGGLSKLTTTQATTTSGGAVAGLAGAFITALLWLLLQWLLCCDDSRYPFRLVAETGFLTFTLVFGRSLNRVGVQIERSDHMIQRKFQFKIRQPTRETTRPFYYVPSAKKSALFKRDEILDRLNRYSSSLNFPVSVL